MPRRLATSRRCREAAFAASLSCLLVAESVSAGDPLRTLARLGPPPGSPSGVSAVIDETRRSVLFDHSAVDVKLSRVGGSQKTPLAQSVRVRLDDESLVGESLELRAKVVVREREVELPARIAVVERDRKGAFAQVVFEHPIFANREATTRRALRLRARRVSHEPVLSHETEAIRVPPDASLAFSYGFLEATSGRKTRFRVKACRDADCLCFFEETAEAQNEHWLERRVPIPAGHGGSEGTLSFRFEALQDDGAPRTDFPVFSVPEIVGAAPSPPGEHDLLLISLDTLRADHLGSYGYARDTSPFIDEFIAARGTVFEQALSTATTTGPSHMSMFTGLPPAVHGVHSNFARALPEGVPLLAEQLRARGFATAAFTENGPMASYRGFDRGFESYFENSRRGLDKARGHVEETLERGARWLRANRDRRRFLFLHTFQVHTPYTPPEAHRADFRDDPPDPEPLRRLPLSYQPIQYDREIRYTDAQLERFFRAMDAEALLTNTIVVLVSDHGDAFLEHGALLHGPSVHREVLHVPLVFLGPGIAAGRRVPEPVSLVDLMPTLLELVGAPATATPHSRSLASRARAGESEPLADRPIFSEGRSGIEILPAKRGVRRRDAEVPVLGVQLGERKLLRYGMSAPRYEYFRLDEDPAALQDRWDPNDPEAAALREVMEQHLRDVLLERAALLGEGRSQIDRPQDLDADRIEKLRALGYLE